MNYFKYIVFFLLLSYSGIIKAERDDSRRQAAEMNRRADVVMKNLGNHTLRDSLAIYRAIIDGVVYSLKCEEYDRMPNRNGNVNPRFENDNIKRLRILHERLLNAGMYIRYNTRNSDEALNAFKLYMKAAESPMLNGMDDNSGLAAYHIAQIGLDTRNYKMAERYADIALRYDNSAQKGAEIKACCMRNQMVTALDSAKYLAVISRLYETEPTNETYFSWLMSFYSRPAQRHKLESFVDKELERNPADIVPWILKGEIAMHAQRWDEAVDAYKHADGIDPGSVPVIYNIGVCLNCKAIEVEDNLRRQHGKLTLTDESEVKRILGESRDYLERVKHRDPHRNKVDWVKPLYMVYTILGDKVKSEELKPLVTGFENN